ncbi:MAG: AAA family ATPase, partial [Thermoguttaceae bacterium]
MYLCRLELRAYGHFTNHTLDLAPGLNIVYGENEAGKSMALRALRQFLYGIDLRCEDNFLHASKNLRIAAVLEGHDGRRVAYVRRKSNAGSLRGEDDAAVADVAELDRLLGGIDRATFQRQFGIDYPQLVAGGREICEGRGDVGEILFAAAAGLANLGQIKTNLDDEAGDLFNPNARASTPRLNKSLAELKERRGTVKKLQLQSGQWEAQQKLLDDTQAGLNTVLDNLRQQQRQRDRLARLEKAIPLFARRRVLETEFEPLRGTPLLPEQFSDRRQDALTRQKVARGERQRIEQSLQGLSDELARTAVPAELLRHAEPIRALQEELGSYRKAQRDRPGLVRQREQLEARIGELLRELGGPPPAVPPPRSELSLTRAQRMRIRKLAQSWQGLRHELGNRQETQRKIEAELARLEAELAAHDTAAAVDDLRDLAGRIQDCGPLEKQLAAQRGELERMEQDATLALKRLGLWHGTPAELEALSVPESETVDRFEREEADAAGAIKELGKQYRQAGDRIGALRQQLDELAREQDVPTENDLAQARQIRDEGWRLVRQAWQGELPDPTAVAAFVARFPPAEDLARAYQRSVEQADQLSDRLRREVDRVARKARLLAEQNEQQETLVRVEQELAAARGRREQQQGDWRALWRPLAVDPAAPREMRQWLVRHGHALEKAEAARKQRHVVGQLQEEIAVYSGRLRQLLVAERIEPDAAATLA